MRQPLNETNISFFTHVVNTVLHQVQSRIGSTFKSPVWCSVKITVQNTVRQSKEAILLYPSKNLRANAVQDYFKPKCTNH